MDPLNPLRSLRDLPSGVADLGPALMRLADVLEAQERETVRQREETVALRVTAKELAEELRKAKVEIKLLNESLEQIREKIPGL